MASKLRHLLFSLLFIAFFASFAQESKYNSIKISEGKYTANELLSILKKEGVAIAWSPSVLPKNEVSILSSTFSASELIQLICSEFELDQKNSNNIILISKKEAEKKLSINGYVRDANTGEPLIGAVIGFSKASSATISNNYGFYSITLPAGIHIISINHLGYHVLTDTIKVSDSNLSYTFKLTSKTHELSEVTISSFDAKLNVKSHIPGFNTIKLDTDGQIPFFLGEVDVLQAAMMLPGISTIGENANGLNIRGGNTDQNLILLDEATIYNPNHLFGLISIFNPQAINNIEIMKGYIPPSYGGRASSVITVHQKNGDINDYHVTGGIGLVSAKFIAEGPIKKNESSFIISGRQSLFNLSFDENSKSRFQDINSKLNWKLNSNNTLLLSGYWGKDRSRNFFETSTDWGNQNFSLRWNHLIGHRIFSNHTAILSEYNYKITQPREAASYIGKSKIINYTLKSDWGYTVNSTNEINFGVQSTLYKLNPGDRIPFDTLTSSSNPIHLDTEHGLETALFLSHQIKYQKLNTQYGFRLSSFQTFGKGTVYTYADTEPKSNESIIDTTFYKSGEIISTATTIDPRVSINYQINENSSIKSSFSRTHQFLHLVSNTISPSPTDIWKLSDRHILPTASNHVSLGYFHNFKHHTWESYLDFYFKKQENLLDYKNGANLLFNENPETEILNTKGRSYGMEVFVKKNHGKLKGWISYTLSKSEIQIKGKFDTETVNGGLYFPGNHDRTHDLSVVGIYGIVPRLSFSSSFNFSTGRPYTFPLSKYSYEGILIPEFGDRNQNRLPNYHRLDISLKWKGKDQKANGSPKEVYDYWTVVLYNVYSRKNIYSYIFKENLEEQNTLVPYYIFDSIIPAITYNFKF